MLNDITNGVNHFQIDLSKYSGVVKIAFYVESTVADNGNNDLYLDNIEVKSIGSSSFWSILLPTAMCLEPSDSSWVSILASRCTPEEKTASADCIFSMSWVVGS